MLDGGADTVLNTVRLGAATGSIAGTVRVERRARRSATSRVHGHQRRHREGGDDADGRQRRHVPRRRSRDAAHVRRSRSRARASAARRSPSTCRAGEARTGVDAVLTGGTGTITGTVTGPDGRPLGGVEVVVTARRLHRPDGHVDDAAPAPGRQLHGQRHPDAGHVRRHVLARRATSARPARSASSCPATQSGVSVQLRRADATISGTVTGGGAADRRRHRRADRRRDDARHGDGVDAERRLLVHRTSPPGSYTLTVTAPGFRRTHRARRRRRRRRRSSATSPWRPVPDARHRHARCSSSCRSASRRSIAVSITNTSVADRRLRRARRSGSTRSG